MLLLASFVLPSLALAAGEWEATFWSGSGCTSLSTGSKQNPYTMRDGERSCYVIPDLGVTQAVDFTAVDSSYRFRLHTSDGCLDVEGIGYEGRPDLPVCIDTSQLQGAVTYSVVKEASTSRRAVGHERRVQALALRAPEPEFNVTETSLHTRAVDSFVLMGVIGAFGFGIVAAEYCPRLVNAENRNLITYPPCAISAIGTVVVSFMTAFGNSGEESKKDQASKRSLFEWDMLPHLDMSLINGYQVSMAPQDVQVDNVGDEWESILINLVHNESGHQSQSTYRTHHATGRHEISSPAEGGSVQARTDNIEVRASNYYAYYAWRNEVRSTFRGRSTSHQEVNRLTGQLYNYARSNDQGIFCASLAVRGTRANQGIFSVQNGVFAPDFSKC